MFIAHRINTIEELKEVPTHMGVEIDLRDKGNKIILSHDPFTDGEDFEEWIKYYQHAYLILNVKSEGIEFEILEILAYYEDIFYFFLDSTIPMINKLSMTGEKNSALRISEYESEIIKWRAIGIATWVWIDCFTKEWILNKELFKKLKHFGFNICLVSPELQQHSKEDIEDYINHLKKEEIVPDMVCSKIYNYELWQTIFN